MRPRSESQQLRRGPREGRPCSCQRRRTAPEAFTRGSDVGHGFRGGLWSQHETLSRGAWGGAGSDAEELLNRSREDAGLAWGDGRSDGERGHSGSRVERVWSHGE